MLKIKKTLIINSLILSVTLSGCAGMKQRQAEIDARGTISEGGYTWDIHEDYEGGNTILAQGLPSKSIAIKVSTKLCKKYGRIAQFQKGEASLFGFMTYDFNCIR